MIALSADSFKFPFSRFQIAISLLATFDQFEGRPNGPRQQFARQKKCTRNLNLIRRMQLLSLSNLWRARLSVVDFHVNGARRFPGVGSTSGDQLFGWERWRATWKTQKATVPLLFAIIAMTHSTKTCLNKIISTVWQEKLEFEDTANGGYKVNFI